MNAPATSSPGSSTPRWPTWRRTATEKGLPSPVPPRRTTLERHRLPGRARRRKGLGVPLCPSSSLSWSCDGCFRDAWFVESAVAEHGEQNADAVAGEAEEGLGVSLAPGPAFVVVGAGGRVVQGGERGEEHRAFELAVSASGCVFAVDRGPR